MQNIQYAMKKSANIFRQKRFLMVEGPLEKRFQNCPNSL